MTRREAIDLAVIESARAYMAASLRADRFGRRIMSDAEFAEYEQATVASLDALQDLRDALSRHSAARRQP